MTTTEKNTAVEARFTNTLMELEDELSPRRGRIVKADPIVRSRRPI
jgi:hypothetical protein